MGRVVKNARVNSQRYHVSVPLVERQPGDDEAAPFSLNGAEPEPLELPSPQAPPLDVDAIASEARRLIDTAEERAKALLQDAFERATQLLAEAEQRGASQVEKITAEARTAGHAEASAAVDRDMADMMATMRNLVDMARVERHKLMESAEPELVRLAVGIAERVLHQQIALDRGVVVEMAKVAIGRLVEKESVTVRVNPGDLERMREHRDELLDSGEIKNFRVVEDQRVDRGGVVVETDGGTIDARISTQLNEAKRVLHIEDEVIVPPADARESSLRAARAS